MQCQLQTQTIHFACMNQHIAKGVHKLSGEYALGLSGVTRCETLLAINVCDKLKLWQNGAHWRRPKSSSELVHLQVLILHQVEASFVLSKISQYRCCNVNSILTLLNGVGTYSGRYLPVTGVHYVIFSPAMTRQYSTFPKSHKAFKQNDSSFYEIFTFKVLYYSFVRLNF